MAILPSPYFLDVFPPLGGGKTSKIRGGGLAAVFLFFGVFLVFWLAKRASQNKPKKHQKKGS